MSDDVFIDGFDDAVKRALTRAGVFLADAAKDEAPVDSGDLQSSIFASDVRKDGDSYSVEVGIDPMELSGEVNYAPFVHFGTGIYGAGKRRIKPRNSKGLNTPFGVFRSVRGQRANPFFDRTIEKYEDEACREFEKGFEL